MTDSHMLTQAQREAMKDSFEAAFPGWKWTEQLGNSAEDEQRFLTACSWKDAFLAGLRYQDEPTEAQVEAAARLIRPFDWGPEGRDDDRARTRELARAVLNAAREAGSE